MAWTDLSSAFTFNSQLTSAQQRALRDNITALANGDSGAPRIQPQAFATYPKNILSTVTAPFSMDLFLESITPPCLIYKTPVDNILHCSLIGITKAVSDTMNAGSVKAWLRAKHENISAEAELTLIAAPRTNTVIKVHTLNPLDLKDFPEYGFLEVSVRFFPYVSTTVHRHIIDLRSIACYMEPYPNDDME